MDYLFSEHLDGTITFNPGVDRLIFDDAGTLPTDVSPGDESFAGIFTTTLDVISGPQAGRFIVLTGDVSALQLTTTNLAFASGGFWVMGDNTISRSGDDLNNALTGTAQADALAGVGGDDLMEGLGGDDLFYLSANGPSGFDTVIGGAGIDTLNWDEAGVALVVNLATNTVSGGSVASDGAQLSGIENVIGGNFNDTFTANSATQVSGRLNTDIVQIFEGGGGSDTINGALGDGRLTVVSYQFSPAAATISLGPFNANDGYGTFDVFNNIDGVIGSAFNDTVFGGSGFPGSADELLQFYEGMAGDDLFIAGSRAAYDHSPFAVVVNLSESAISGNFYGAGTIAVNSGTARDGWDSVGGGTDTISGIDAGGSKFDDTMVGSDDDDNWFEGQGGNDYIDGRGSIDDEVDSAEYMHATGAVYVNLGLGTAVGIGGDNSVGSDTLVNIEGVRGSDFNDSLVGGGSGAFSAIHVEFFQGMAGDDTLDGGDSSLATLDVAEYWADPSAVIVNLSAAAINPFGINVAARTARDGYGVAGHPAGIDTLVNINGASGSQFDDYLFGSDSNDWLQGNAGHDTMIGGAGADTVVFDGGGANINLVTGIASDGMGFTDMLFGIENVLGSAQADTIIGDGQDNRLDGDGGDDTIDGGAGSDTASYEFFHEDGVQVDLADGTAIDGDDDVDTLLNIENVVGSVLEDDIHGDAAANVLDGFIGDDALVGRAGKDTLIGGAGSDTLDGGAGADSMIGGEGDDTYFIDNVGDRVVEVAGGGNDTVITSASITLPANVEIIIFTGGASVVLTGNAQNNIISGGAADDTLSGGAGSDTVSYAGATTAVTINLASNVATGQGRDVLSGFENATGGTKADTLIGNSGKNVLDGSGGADRMTGGFGNDTYVVDNVKDKVIETSNSAVGALLLPGDADGPALAGAAGVIDTVISAVNYSIATLQFVENLTLDSSAARATGNALANKLNGNDGNNILNGGAGNDTLDGKVGSDRLIGGTGNDTLVWGAGDTIDGGAGKDKLKVSENLDLVSLANAALKGIETIDMNGGGNNTLTLNQQDLLDLSTSTNALTVFGNAGDMVNATGFASAGVSGGFDRYTSGAAVLLVDQDLNVVI
jgi:Ca2+-binding RTX toxin-like protein